MLISVVDEKGPKIILDEAVEELSLIYVKVDKKWTEIG